MSNQAAAADVDLATLTVESVQEGFATNKFTAESLASACLRQSANGSR